jgi:hypothetical protein
MVEYGGGERWEGEGKRAQDWHVKVDFGSKIVRVEVG